jgi:hypothetical protein
VPPGIVVANTHVLFLGIRPDQRLGKLPLLVPSASGACRSFGVPGWGGNEPISRNPSGVPVLDSGTAHGAFKAADLARFHDMFAAVINRAAFTGPMTGL